MDQLPAILALALLLQGVIIAVLSTGVVLATGHLFREVGRQRTEMLLADAKLRADLDKLDEVAAEQGALWKALAEPNKKG